jgi:hypothetical protein
LLISIYPNSTRFPKTSIQPHGLYSIANAATKTAPAIPPLTAILAAPELGVEVEVEVVELLVELPLVPAAAVVNVLAYVVPYVVV